MISRSTAIVTGASGQDGSFLVERLLADGWTVHAFSRRALDLRTGVRGSLVEHRFQISEPSALFKLVAEVRPAELYNFAGESSVARSLLHPVTTWETNATFVARLLDVVHRHSPDTRLYQASSTEMFGEGRGDTVVHSEDSPLNPGSPYAAAKAAAHLLCGVYRRQFGLRVACGILSNHESHRRPAPFLSRKIVDHVRTVRSSVDRGAGYGPPLRVGNVLTERDWGFAPDYIEAIVRIIRQIEVRSQFGPTLPDEARSYHDYLVGTGTTHSVRDMIDTAFGLAGIELDWHLSADVAAARAVFAGTNTTAVEVDPRFIRPGEPRSIRTDPARAATELGWSARPGLELFLDDMLRLSAPLVEEHVV